jgi:hypothetical protein
MSVGVAFLCLALALPADGAVLCKKKNGLVAVRDATCKRRESALDVRALGLGLQGPKGDPGPRGQAGEPAQTLVGRSTAFDLTGRIDQDATSFTYYGYLTAARDLPQSVMFSGNPAFPDYPTARFTFRATATLTERYVLASVFRTGGTGTMTIYFQDTPVAGKILRLYDSCMTNADCSGGTGVCDGRFCLGTPDLFAAGIPIATASMHYQEIDNIQAPNIGVATHTLDVEQVTAPPFTVDGHPVQFGNAGQRWRVTLTGESVRTDPVTPKIETVLQGTAVITP